MYMTYLKSGNGKEVFIEFQCPVDLSKIEEQLNKTAVLKNFPGIYQLPSHEYVLINIKESNFLEEGKEAELILAKKEQNEKLYDFLIHENELDLKEDIIMTSLFIYEKYLKNMSDTKLEFPFKRYEISNIKLKNYKERGTIDFRRGSADIDFTIKLSDHNTLYSNEGDCWCSEVMPIIRNLNNDRELMKVLTEYRRVLNNNIKKEAHSTKMDKTNAERALFAVSYLMQRIANFNYLHPLIQNVNINSIKFESDNLNPETIDKIGIDDPYEKVFGSPELVIELLRKDDQIENQGIEFKDLEMRVEVIRK